MIKFKILAAAISFLTTVSVVVFLKSSADTNQAKVEVNEAIPVEKEQGISEELAEMSNQQANKPVYTKHNIKLLPPEIIFEGEKFLPKEVVQDGEIKKNSLVNPPVKGMEPKGKIYTINADEEQNITSEAGSTIHIPANTFVNKQGEAVKGEVDVYYCEYNEIFDIVTSGIPMTYDSGGQINHFESAGMFDIQATCEGEEVSIAEGKQITVDVANTNKDEDFNFYELDENRGGWVNQVSNITPVPFRGALPLFDNTFFSERYKSLDYFTDYSDWAAPRNRLFKRTIDAKRLMPGVTTVRGSRSGSKMTHMRSSFRIKRMPKEKGDRLNVVRFKILSRSTLRRKYAKPTHLRDFVDKTWVYKGELDRFSFWKEYARAKRCYDIRILYNEGSEDFTFELKSSEGFVNINAYTYDANPETVSSSEVQSSMRKFERIYNKYKENLNELEQYFDSAIAEQSRNYAGISESVGLSIDDKAYQLVSRTVTLTNLGLYNCDRLMLMVAPKNVLAKFIVPETKEELTPKMVYVVDKNANGMFTYSGSIITVSPNYTRCLILVLGNNRLAYVTGEDVEKGYTGPNSEFVAHLSKSKERNELKKELGL